MYCTNCGKQIDNISKFCPYCGEMVVPLDKPVDQNFKMFFNDIRFNYSSSKMGGAVGRIFLCIIMQAIFIFMIFFDKLWSGFPISTRITIKAMYIFFIIIFLVIILMNIIKASKISKTFLCLKNDGLYGMGGSSYGYFVIHNFNCRYQDILNVSTEKGFLIVNTLRGNYYFAIDNYDQAANEIYERIRVVKGAY